MSLIIDGHNLIPKLPGMSLDLPDDEEQLIKLLIEFAGTVKKRIIVYFDNAPPGYAGLRRYGSVSAYFVSEGRSADNAIRIKLNRLGKEAKNWTVVSSDHEVGEYVRFAGARLIKSEDFARAIFVALRDRKQSEKSSTGIYPEKDEVRRWLEIFERRKQDEER